MSKFERFYDQIANSYHVHIEAQDKEPAFLILVAFLITFILVRFITHSIRANRFHRVLRNIGTPGGTHLHHLVPGILLLMIGGYLGIALSSDWPREPFAILFGIGMALTLDEFALWLHLKDVYWAKQGRQSLDAIIIATTIVITGALGFGFWRGVFHAGERLIRSL